MSARVGLRPAALLALGLGTLALAGLPAPSVAREAPGRLFGCVFGADGAPVPDAAVGLFDAQHDELLEVTHTDAAGRFGLQQNPGRHHLVVRPPEESSLLPAFALDRAPAERRTDFVLERGVPVRVRVIGPDDAPLPFAEVRAYAPGDARRATCVVARVATDSAGCAELRAPRTAYLAAYGRGETDVPDWTFARRLGADAERIPLRVGAGRAIRGTVVDEFDRPLAGVRVSAWEAAADGEEPRWLGICATRAEGAFLFHGRPERTILRAVADDATHLAAERYDAGNGHPVLRLEAARPSAIQLADTDGRTLAGSVWIWSGTSGAWSARFASDARGVFHAPLDEAPGFRVAATAETPARAPLEVRRVDGGLELRLERASLAREIASGGAIGIRAAAGAGP